MISLQDIQRRMREAIKTAPMPKKDIAKQLGISQSTLSKYLHHDKFPSLETFANLCMILDVSADDILCLTSQ